MRLTHQLDSQPAFPFDDERSHPAAVAKNRILPFPNPAPIMKSPAQDVSKPAASVTAKPKSLSDLGQVVLVFQGGGALGAYQIGVYEALRERGVEPDWIIGTSIGAINGAILAGNAPENRLAALEEFWRRVSHNDALTWFSSAPNFGPFLANFATITSGLPGFFKPNPLAFLGASAPLGPESAGYYSTAPLAATLADLIDLKLLNSGAPRLTVGAAKVATGEMRYFDSRDMPLDLKHVMASGALPPAFPAVRIDGDLYWDGGIVSNTPVEAIFDDRPRKNGIIFSVHIWQPHGAEPNTITQVMNRQKDVQYSSRAATHIARQKQLHRLRHVIAELAKRLPEAQRATPEVRELASYGCLTRMHVVRLLAPALAGEDSMKDIDFSREGVRQRRQFGREDTLRALDREPWVEETDPLEGFILHEIDR